MTSILFELFHTYRNGELYNESLLDIDYSWLKDKIDEQDISQIESQTAALLLANEEETFIHAFKYAWNLFKELEHKSADHY